MLNIYLKNEEHELSFLLAFFFNNVGETQCNNNVSFYTLLPRLLSHELLPQKVITEVL